MLGQGFACLLLASCCPWPTFVRPGHAGGRRGGGPSPCQSSLDPESGQAQCATCAGGKPGPSGKCSFILFMVFSPVFPTEVPASRGSGDHVRLSQSFKNMLSNRVVGMCLALERQGTTKRQVPWHHRAYLLLGEAGRRADPQTRIFQVVVSSVKEVHQLM